LRPSGLPKTEISIQHRVKTPLPIETTDGFLPADVFTSELIPTARRLFKIALASDRTLTNSRWSEVPDNFLLPFVRFTYTRHAQTPRGTPAAEDELLSPKYSDKGCDGEDEEEIAAEVVQMVLGFATYIESAERRGVMPAAGDPAAMWSLYAQNFMRLLPEGARDEQGRRVLLAPLRNLVDVPEESVERMICWFFLHSSLDPSLNVSGLSVVYDLSGVTLPDAYRLLRMDSVRLAPAGCFPIRMRRIIVVNQPWWMRAIWGAVWRLLDPKLRTRVKFLGPDFESLHQMICKDLLPPTLGGTNQAAAEDGWWQECLYRGHMMDHFKPSFEIVGQGEEPIEVIL